MLAWRMTAVLCEGRDVFPDGGELKTCRHEELLKYKTSIARIRRSKNEY
jgi:hypothetical protein